MALSLDGTTFTVTVYAVRSMWKRIYHISFVTSLESNLTDLMAEQRRQAPGKYIYIYSKHTEVHARSRTLCSRNSTGRFIYEKPDSSQHSPATSSLLLCANFILLNFRIFICALISLILYILISTSNPLMHQIICLHGISNGRAMHRRCQLADEQLFTRSHVAPNTRPHHRPINRK